MNGTLFDKHTEPMAEPLPKSRKTDPGTSREAARKHATKASTNRERIRDIVYQYPGLTSPEIAEKLADESIDQIECSRRLPECEDLEKRKPRKCTVKGSKCLTWWVKDD